MKIRASFPRQEAVPALLPRTTADLTDAYEPARRSRSNPDDMRIPRTATSIKTWVGAGVCGIGVLASVYGGASATWCLWSAAGAAGIVGLAAHVGQRSRPWEHALRALPQPTQGLVTARLGSLSQPEAESFARLMGAQADAQLSHVLAGEFLAVERANVEVWCNACATIFATCTFADFATNQGRWATLGIRDLKSLAQLRAIPGMSLGKALDLLSPDPFANVWLLMLANVLPGQTLSILEHLSESYVGGLSLLKDMQANLQSEELAPLLLDVAKLTKTAMLFIERMPTFEAKMRLVRTLATDDFATHVLTPEQVTEANVISVNDCAKDLSKTLREAYIRSQLSASKPHDGEPLLQEDAHPGPWMRILAHLHYAHWGIVSDSLKQQSPAYRGTTYAACNHFLSTTRNLMPGAVLFAQRLPHTHSVAVAKTIAKWFSPHTNALNEALRRLSSVQVTDVLAVVPYADRLLRSTMTHDQRMVVLEGLIIRPDRQAFVEAAVTFSRRASIQLYKQRLIENAQLPPNAEADWDPREHVLQDIHAKGVDVHATGRDQRTRKAMQALATRYADSFNLSKSDASMVAFLERERGKPYMLTKRGSHTVSAIVMAVLKQGNTEKYQLSYAEDRPMVWSMPRLRAFVWHCIESYAEHSAGPAVARDREQLMEKFGLAIADAAEDGYVVCAAGQVQRLMTALQGFFAGVQVDELTDELKPEDFVLNNARDLNNRRADETPIYANFGAWADDTYARARALFDATGIAIVAAEIQAFAALQGELWATPSVHR